jgi:putative acetyltransferase
MSSPCARPERLDSPVVQRLIAALNAELQALYPEAGANHFRLDAEEVAPGRGVFLVVYDGEEPVGCGAFRRLASDTAELKRMYVVPSRRRQGVGLALIEALERQARAEDLVRLVLETGLRQPEAVGLYRRAGFTTIPAFGAYAGSQHSLCMSKELVVPQPPPVSLLNIDPVLARAVEDPAAFERERGLRVAAVIDLVKDIVAQIESYRSSMAAAPEWGGYLTADEARRIVGTCAFKGPPDRDGVVEIAYFTFPPYERHGYGSAMARALLEVAGGSGQVSRVRAHTLPEDNASSRLLRRLRFSFEGTAEDPDDGPVWRWERPLEL